MADYDDLESMLEEALEYSEGRSYFDVANNVHVPVKDYDIWPECTCAACRCA